MKLLKSILIIFAAVLVIGLLFSIINKTSNRDAAKDKCFSDTDNGDNKKPDGEVILPDTDDTDNDNGDETPDSGNTDTPDSGNTDSGNTDGDNSGSDPDTPVINVIGGEQGFTTDFSDMSIYAVGSDKYKLQNSEGLIYSTELYVQDGYGEYTVENDRLNYFCTEMCADSIYPKMKLKPFSGNERLYLSDFKVLTVDFDIIYSIDTASDYSTANEFKALFNTRSSASGSTVTDNSFYFKFSTASYEPGHYTFVYHDTGDLNTMKIFVYKDGILCASISNFITATEYNANDFYVACLNLELTRTTGDKVAVDNVEYHYFAEDYSGAIMDLVENPDVNLKTCKDSVLYGG